jgi:GNAT superfamily N-acetyltransferase
MTVADDDRFPFADLALARRLEMAEARSNADFVETHARLSPECGARWIEVAGAYAMYDGVASPATQTFGLGLNQPATSADLAALEAFFRKRGAPVYHEVSPLADPSLVTLLNERGYQPFEFTSVLFRPIRRDLQLSAARNERIQVRLIREDEHELWAQTSARGWSDSYEFADQLLDLGRIGAKRPTGRAFLAELDGRPIAAGGLSLSEGVVHLAGASTVPEARHQGAQLALLESRLRYGAEAGCDLALMGALPGSASQRNAERHGFRIAYTRIKWRLVQRTG